MTSTAIIVAALIVGDIYARAHSIELISVHATAGLIVLLIACIISDLFKIIK